MTHPRLTTARILARATLLARRSLLTVLGMGASLGAVWGVVDYFGLGSAANIGIGFGTVILSASLTVAVDDRYVHGTKQQRSDLMEDANRFGPLIGASFLSGIGILFGLVLLVVPGLVFAAWWGLHMPLIVREGRGAIESMEESKRRVQGSVAACASAWLVAGLAAFGIVIGLMWDAPIGDRLPLEWAIRECVALAIAFPILPLVASAMYDLLQPGDEPDVAVASSHGTRA
jgi:hypothetical protein